MQRRLGVNAPTTLLYSLFGLDVAAFLSQAWYIHLPRVESTARHVSGALSLAAFLGKKRVNVNLVFLVLFCIHLPRVESTARHVSGALSAIAFLGTERVARSSSYSFLPSLVYVHTPIHLLTHTTAKTNCHQYTPQPSLSSFSSIPACSMRACLFLVTFTLLS
jgi:hypothetical protein